MIVKIVCDYDDLELESNGCSCCSTKYPVTIENVEKAIADIDLWRATLLDVMLALKNIEQNYRVDESKKFLDKFKE